VCETLDQYHVELPFRGRHHHALIVSAFLAGAQSLVDVFFDHDEAPALSVLAQWPGLRFRVLPVVRTEVTK
jgi:hypothetical protein